MTFTIEPNKVIALVGKSGCGKSSVIALLERFYNPSGGAVKLDENNITELDSSWYHSNISLVQ